MSIIEDILKNSENINQDLIESSHLSQSKLFLKILGFPYYLENTNKAISPDIILGVLKELHIFNNIALASKPRIITSPNSNSAVIWINIWDSQFESKAKSISNHHFNIEWFIATICGTSTNPGVSQCKNCWRWGHSTFGCWSHVSRCVKCNGPHKTEHHRERAWCCKENTNVNLPRLVTKEGKLCPCSFKCVNCKDNHQVDSYTCPYWCNCFNKIWHGKKQQELWGIRVQ